MAKSKSGEIGVASRWRASPTTARRRSAIVLGVGVGATVIVLALSHVFSDPAATHLGQGDSATKDELSSASGSTDNRVVPLVNPFLRTQDSALGEPVSHVTNEVVAPSESMSESGVLADNLLESSVLADDLLQSAMPELPPLEEIERLHAQQLSALASANADPTRLVALPASSDPTHAMTMGELDLLHDTQRAEAQRQFAQDGFFEVSFPDDGHWVVDLEALSERHKEEESQAVLHDSEETLRLPAFAQEDGAVVVTGGELLQRLDAQAEEAKRHNGDAHRPIS